MLPGRSDSMPVDLLPFIQNTGRDNRTGLAFIDREGCFLFVSDGLAAMNDVPAADHVGRAVSDVVPDVWEFVRDVFARALEGEAGTVEFTAPTAQNPTSPKEWVEYWSPVAVDGEIIGVTVTVIDVTELRTSQRHEHELTQRQASLNELARRALADSTVEEVFSVALDALQKHLDVPFTRITKIVPGADSLQVLQDVGWDQALVGSIPVGTRAGSFAQYVLRERRCVQFADLDQEHRFRAAPVFVAHGIRSGVAAPVFMGSDPWGMLASYDRRVRQFSADDEVFLEDLATILGLMLQERESRAFREEILSMASHEIRTPLTSVIGLAQHVKRRVSQGRIEGAIELIDPLVSEAFRVDQVLTQWNELAAAESNLHAASSGPVDIREVVSGRIGEFRLRHPDVLVRERYEPDLPEVQSDPTRIAEIVDNLMENGRKYAGTEMDIVVERLADGVSVQCRDYGPGIAPELISRIFDRFFRGGAKSEHGGMGLGLYISRKLAEGLGGTLEVTSAPGEGACFALRLPAVSPHLVRD